MNQDRALKNAFLIGAILLFGAIINHVRESLVYGHDSWQITEWLINYAGGFVRRGLPGEALYYLSSHLGIQANHIAIAISLALYFFVLAFFLLKTINVLPPVLIISSVLMGAPAYHDFIVRKDVLGIAVLILCLSISKVHLAKLTRLILINCVASAAILSHEAFFFFGVPSLVALNLGEERISDRSPIRSLIISVSSMTPSVVVFALIVVYKGNAEVSDSINASWAHLWPLIEPGKCCFDQPNAAIEALQWSARKAVSFPYSVLTTFSMGIYVPLAWVITMVACFYFMTQFIDRTNVCERTRMSTILIFQFAVMIPLYIVGWDFGRWIFLWTASSLTLFIFRFQTGHSLFNMTNRLATSLMSWKLLQKAPSPWLLLIFGIPGVSWCVEYFIGSSPLGYYVDLVARFF